MYITLLKLVYLCVGLKSFCLWTRLCYVLARKNVPRIWFFTGILTSYSNMDCTKIAKICHFWLNSMNLIWNSKMFFDSKIFFLWPTIECSLEIVKKDYLIHSSIILLILFGVIHWFLEPEIVGIPADLGRALAKYLHTRSFYLAYTAPP